MLDISLDNHRLETLIEINTLINSNYTDLKALLTRIIQSATRLTLGETSSLLLVHPENNKLYFEIALGKKGTEIKRFSLEMGEGIAGWVAKHNTSLIVNDVQSDKRFQSKISQSIGFPTSSILAVPMRIKENCIGVIEIINKQDGRKFNDDDLKWLEIFATQAAIAIQNAKAYQQAKEEIVLLQEQVRTTPGYHTFIYASNAIKEKLKIAYRAAETDSSVLILGESGVGKELFAEQIHLHSKRKDKPFIRVNCAALPEGLLESELFGHVKGAYTDATDDRRGRFELADRGTLFLDEVADMPLAVQAKLLRVLQNKTFERVGSSQPITVDVRILAATNSDIEKLVQQGLFRTDLYYRLNVLPIYVPPLRSRREDIPLMADTFLDQFSRQMKKQTRGFSEEASAQLLSYTWPGNVRELENAIERAVVLTQEGEYITADTLFSDAMSFSDTDEFQGKNLKEAVNLFKKLFVANTLCSNGWNQTISAEVMGIQRTYLSRLIKELKISRD